MNRSKILILARCIYRPLLDSSNCNRAFVCWRTSSARHSPCNDIRGVQKLNSTSATCFYSNIGATEQNNEDSSRGRWDLYVGLCLERRPVVTKELTSLEKKYSKFLEQNEFELSKKSDHEVRLQTDKILLEKIKAGEAEQASVVTAQDFEDASNKELQEFTVASRQTEADRKKDLHSLERSLDSHLLLAVSQKLGNEFKWIVPHFKLNDEASLREVADKGLAQNFPEVKAKILGNAPWGFYKYKYPKTVAGAVGAKVFFYKAQVESGNVAIASSNSSSTIEFKDFKWLTRAELSDYFGQNYVSRMHEFLIPEFGN